MNDMPKKYAGPTQLVKLENEDEFLKQLTDIALSLRVLSERDVIIKKKTYADTYFAPTPKPEEILTDKNPLSNLK